VNDQNYTVFNAMVDIVAAPGKALDQVKDRTRWLWWPLLIILLVSAGSLAFYNYWVDFDWLIDETIRALPADTPPEAGDRVRDFMSPGTNTMTGIIAIVVITFIIYSVQAVYLNLANKVTTGAEIRYGQWFSFSAWTGFVGVFNSLIMLIVIAMADNNQVGQSDLVPLSMNSLFIHASPGDPWFTWGISLGLVNIWMLVLMSLGYARWTGASMVKSSIIAVLPWAAIFGIWAAII
jgi:hypothetical protein